FRWLLDDVVGLGGIGNQLTQLHFAFVDRDDQHVAGGQGDARISGIALAARDVLVVTIDEGEVQLGELIPYAAQPDDIIKQPSEKSRFVIREGQRIGDLIGRRQGDGLLLRTPDRYLGRRVDLAVLTDPGAWDVRDSAGVVPVVSAFRKSRITNSADTGAGRPEVCWQHQVFLKLKRPAKGLQFSVTADSDTLPSARSSDASVRTASPAIHVSMLGFRPSDPLKHAFVSCWMGDGGELQYDETELDFVVRDVAGGDIKWRGKGKRHRDADQPGDHRGLQRRPSGGQSNDAGVATFRLDFSGLSDPGDYEIVLRGIGTSEPFPIREDVYQRTCDAALDGLWAHAWGITQDIKLSDGSVFRRPAAVPIQDDAKRGRRVFRTEAKYTNANFAEIVAGNPKPAPDLRIDGGFMDAGDFDRNKNHWIITYLLSDLAQRMPASPRRDRLIDAAKWNADLWVRLQDDDGGVPSAVEYSAHPQQGEPSWLNSLPIYVCAASVESDACHAAAAARLARALRKLGRTDEADMYQRSALAAIDWLGKQYDLAAIDSSSATGLSDTVALALAECVATASRDRDRTMLHGYLDRRVKQAWSSVYPPAVMSLLTLLESPTEAEKLNEPLKQKIIASAKHTIEQAYLEGSYRRSPFGVLKNGWVPLSWGAGSWPDWGSAILLRCWKRFDAPEYLDAAISGMAYAGGGNPVDRVYMTGVHPRSIRNILHCDTRFVGRAAPRGIPIYGPARTDRRGDAWPLNWHLATERTIYPQYEDWPGYENVHEYWNWALLMEYTVHQSHAPVIYFAGMLDLREADE
ncbi:MAG: glycoside hydrolase family 9 protein, partial [Planctomycetota bacterium]